MSLYSYFRPVFKDLKKVRLILSWARLNHVSLFVINCGALANGIARSLFQFASKIQDPLN